MLSGGALAVTERAACGCVRPGVRMGAWRVGVLSGFTAPLEVVLNPFGHVAQLELHHGGDQHQRRRSGRACGPSTLLLLRRRRRRQRQLRWLLLLLQGGYMHVRRELRRWAYQSLRVESRGPVAGQVIEATVGCIEVAPAASAGHEVADSLPHTVHRALRITQRGADAAERAQIGEVLTFQWRVSMHPDPGSCVCARSGV